MGTAIMSPTATDRFREKALEVKEDMREMKEDLKELGALAPDAAREKMAQMSASFEKGKERAAEASCKVEEFIQEHPVQSVLIAAGAGALLGFLASRLIK